SVRCGDLFFFQAEDGIRDRNVTGFRRVLFRSCSPGCGPRTRRAPAPRPGPTARAAAGSASGTPLRHRPARSEEHTSELQSRFELVCRLLLEKKKGTAPWPQTTCPAAPLTPTQTLTASAATPI